MFLNIDDVVERVRRPYLSIRGSIPVTVIRQGAETTSATSSNVDSPAETRVVPAPRRAAENASAWSKPVPPQHPVLGRIRAWMIVIPVDAAMLLAPWLWTSEQAKAIISMTVLSIFFVTNGRYRARLHLSVLDELPILVTKILTAAAVIATVIALRHDQMAVSTFLVNVAISLGLVIVGRIITTWMIGWSRRHGTTVHRTVLIGGGALAAELAQVLVRHRRYGLVPVGYVDDSADGIASVIIPRLGGLDDLDLCVTREGVDVLLVTDGGFSERRLLEAVRTPQTSRCDLLVVPRMHHFATQTGAGDHIGSIPVTRIRTPSLDGVSWGVKRAFDVVAAGLMLLLAAPVIGVCALIVRLEGGPGVIFRQPRVGRHGVVFDCLKLRSLRPADDLESATNWSVADDLRMSRVGRFLRRTSIDELPQLWNIIRGEMTLVGPRPERPHFVDKFSSEYDRYAHRHRVQAGLTGLAQVSGLRGDTSIADRARYDNYYIEHWSLWLDVKILIRTFAEVLFARGR
jgi:exopolysaccharide biosynthesis polyprenyl glycosylphosphotransferase